MAAEAAAAIRLCHPAEAPRIGHIINMAAEAYRGVIPGDCFHDPYMPDAVVRSEIDAGVVFWGLQEGGQIAAVMGMQRVQDACLIRHAYVLPEAQNRGIGGRLLSHLRTQSDGPWLVGAWTAAAWAIAFYRRQGFALIRPERAATLLRRYWTVSDRQIETSTVLAATAPGQEPYPA